MASRIGNLNWNVPIVDARGSPTAEFIRKWNEQQAINGSLPDVSTPAGVSAILDKLSASRGSLLVRRNTQWQGIASPNNGTKFLNGTLDPQWASVRDSDLSVTDNTSNNVSVAQHGFAPKLPGSATQYLDGTGAWSTPAGGGGGGLDWFGAALAQKPAAANFTLATSTSVPPGAALVDTASSMDIRATSVAGSSAMCAVQTITSTPFTATALLSVNADMIGFNIVGIVLCDVPNSRAILYGTGATGSTALRLDVNRLAGGAFGIDSNVSDTSPGLKPIDPYIPSWLRLKHDGTNLKMSISNDGSNFREAFSEVATAYLANFSRVGLIFKFYTATAFSALRAYSWSLTYP